MCWNTALKQDCLIYFHSLNRNSCSCCLRCLRAQIPSRPWTHPAGPTPQLRVCRSRDWFSLWLCSRRVPPPVHICPAFIACLGPFESMKPAASWSETVWDGENFPRRWLRGFRSRDWRVSFYLFFLIRDFKINI